MKSSIESSVVQLLGGPVMKIYDDTGKGWYWEDFVRNVIGSGALTAEQKQWALDQILAAHEAGVMAFNFALQSLKSQR